MFDRVEAFCRPASVSEAIRLLRRAKGQARVVAGGTDLAIADASDVRLLVDITRAGLSYIRKQSGLLAIGATTTLAEIETAGLLQKVAGGILPKAAATCGSVSIRNMATIGGNLANASSAADMATPLLLLGASAVIADSRGRRKLGLRDYLTGASAGRFSRSILLGVTAPEPSRGKNCGWSFQKLGRTAVDISIVNVAAGLQLDAKGQVKWARLAMGAVAPAPIRAERAEQLLAGRVICHEAIAHAAAAVSEAISPISDVRASSEYRREMSAVLTARALEECVAQAGGSL